MTPCDLYTVQDLAGRWRKRVEWVCVDRRYKVNPAPALTEIFSVVEAEFRGIDEADIGIFAHCGKLILTDMPEYIGIPGSDHWIEWRNNERVRITLSELRRAALLCFAGSSLGKLWLAADACSSLKMGAYK